MWPSRSHTLAPLTSLTYIKRKCKWTQVKQDTFNEIKQIMARDTLLTYTDYNQTFKTHTNASVFQLGEVISQKGEPINFNSRKLTDAQISYKVSEKELPSIIENLKVFRKILLGYRLRIYTDHKILPCKTFSTDIVFIWTNTRRVWSRYRIYKS